MAKHTKKMNSADRDQLEIEKNNPLTKPLLHEGHGRPTTRRDFLSTGLLSFSGLVMAPSILSVLARPNFALAASTDGCEVASAVRLPAFVNVNLSGGAALSGNVAMLNQAGDPLPSYTQLGQGADAAQFFTTDFQGVTFHGVRNGRLSSQFLAGVQATADAGTRGKTSFLSVAVPLGDDTGNNMIDPTGLITAAGLTGDLLPKMGTRGTATGVNQMYAKMAPPSPLVVQNINDLTGALSPASSLTQKLSVDQRKAMLRLVSNLSGTQAREVASSNSSSGTALSKLVQCATDKNIELSTNPNPGIDPRQDANLAMSNLWQMGQNNNAVGQNQNNRVVMGSMVYNALKGNSGAIGLELGGYDYHGNDRVTVQDARDFTAGQLVGQILQSAATMNQKVFITVTSDGSVGAGGGAAAGANFTGDRGSGGAQYILAFDPAGRPAMKNPSSGAKHQLGWYNNGQGAVDTSLTGSAELAGVATFANYLAFAKQSALLDKVLPRQYSQQELEYILRFA